MPMPKSKTQAEKAYMRDYMKAYREEGRYTPKRVNITLSSAEYSTLKQRAKKEEKTVTRLVKELALVSLYERDNFPEDVSHRLNELAIILRGVATNINQMARHSNQLKQFSEQEALILKLRLLEDQVHDFLISKQLRNKHDH